MCCCRRESTPESVVSACAASLELVVDCLKFCGLFHMQNMIFSAQTPDLIDRLQITAPNAHDARPCLFHRVHAWSDIVKAGHESYDWYKNTVQSAWFGDKRMTMRTTFTTSTIQLSYMIPSEICVSRDVSSPG